MLPLCHWMGAATKHFIVHRHCESASLLRRSQGQINNTGNILLFLLLRFSISSLIIRSAIEGNISRAIVPPSRLFCVPIAHQCTRGQTAHLLPHRSHQQSIISYSPSDRAPSSLFLSTKGQFLKGHPYDPLYPRHFSLHCLHNHRANACTTSFKRLTHC
jgi:hypothetical protein